MMEFDTAKLLPGGRRLGRKRVVMFAGFALFAIAVVSVSIFLASSKDKGDSTSEDNQMTQDLKGRLEKNSDGDALVLDSSVLRSSFVSEIVMESLNTDSVRISSPKVSIYTQPKSGHEAVLVEGLTTLFGAEFEVVGSLYYEQEQLHMELATVAVNDDFDFWKVAIGGSSLMGVNFKEHDLVLSTHERDYVFDGRHHALQVGWNVVGKMTLGGTEELNALVKMIEESSTVDVANVDANAASSIQVPASGTLRPNVFLQFPVPDIHIGKYVVLSQINVTVKTKPDEFKFEAICTVLLPDNPIKFNVAGTFSKDDIEFQGSLIGQWKLPGMPDDMSLKEVGIHVIKDSDHPDGYVAIQGGIQYGKASLVLKVELPMPNGGGVAYEAFPTGVFKLSDLPLIPADFPNLDVSNAAFVFSPFEGEFDFSDVAEAPQSPVQVVKGLNLFAKMSLDKNAATSIVSDVTSGPTDLVLHGYISLDKKMLLEADLQNVEINKDFAVTDAKLKVENFAPYLSVDCKMALKMETDTLNFDVSGTWDGQSITFDGKMDGTWVISVGKHGLSVSDLSLHLVDQLKPTKSVSGEVKGTITIGSLSIQLDLQYPAPGTDGCYRFEAKEVSGLSVSALSSVMMGDNTESSFGLESDVSHDVFHSAFSNVDLVIYPNCGKFDVSATIDTKVFGAADVSVEFSKEVSASSLSNDLIQGIKSQSLSNPQIEVSPTFKSTAVDILSSISTSAQQSEVFPGMAESNVIGASYGEVLSAFKTAVDGLKEDATVKLSDGNSYSAKTVVDALVSGSSSLSSAKVPSVSGGNWEITVVIKPHSGWEMKTSPIGKHFPALDVVLPSFVLSSTVKSVPVNSRDGPQKPTIVIHITCDKGFTFFARLLFTSSDIQPVKNALTCTLQELDIQGKVGKDWYLDVSIPSGCLHIGDRFAVSSLDLKIQSNPWFTLVADIAIQLEDQSITFSVDGVVSKEEISFSGKSLNSWHLAIGHGGLVLDSLELDLDLKFNPSSYTAKIAGGFLIGNNQITLEVDLGTGVGFEFIGKIQETVPLTLRMVLEKLFGPDVEKHIHLPSEIKKDLLDTAFLSGEVDIKTEPLEFYLDGKVELFHKVLDFHFDFKKHSANALALSDTYFGNWIFTYGIVMDKDFHFSDMFPKITTLDDLELDTPAVIVTNAQHQTKLPEVAFTMNADEGFNFFFGLELAKHGLNMINKWSGKNYVVVQGSIESFEQFKLLADFVGDFKLFPNAEVEEAGVFFSVDGFTDIKLGLECDLALNLGKNHDDRVEFYGDVFVSTEGAGIDMGMKNPWVHPFGIPGVTFEQSELSVTIGPTMVPTQFGIAGGIQIGDVEGSAAVYADLMDITHSCIAAELENIDLAKIVNSILGNVVHIPSSLSRTILDVSFEKVAMSANLAGHPIVYNGHTYDPGFRFEVDKLDLWEIIKGSALVDIDLTKGLEVDGNLDAVHFGDILSISGVESKTSPVRLNIRLMKDEVPKFLMDGAIDLLGLYLASEVELDDERAMVFVEFKESLFDFLMNLTSIGQLPHPSDFSVLGELNDGVLDWVSKHIPEEVDKAKSDVDKELDDALDWLKKKQAGVDSIEDQIKKIKAEDQRELSDAEKKVLDAKNDVARAKSHVDQLSNEIHDYEDKLHHLHWYQAWKQVKYRAIIAGLWVAKEAADGVLDIAEGVLDLAEKALEKLPDIDPRVIALEAEHGVAEAALVAAEEVVKATRASLDGLAKVIEWAAKEVGEIFNIEEAMISGSYSKLKKGDLCDVELKGVFIGHHVDFNVDLDLTSIDKFLSNVWHALMKIL
eukprot:TRINITY_DN1961_c0_g1_i1.p1 TRINITY_DN1961_c0_g1~~TRINITY_DN1961_c0_g1_i1.p1  ORF type:complete len:1801 (+),score=542.84 TRINITY_DN1961_c0_g1_i1:184-5586(+)